MTDILVGFGALIVALFAAWGFGRSGAKTAQKLDASKKYAKTRKAMDDVESHTDDDPALLADWLRERGQR